MTTLQFYLVDVFSVEKYTGNQLAVFLDASHLSAEQMQAIARELNFSETTFITSRHPSQEGYSVRIFTPAQELPFAGHPTLGTAYIIQKVMIKEQVEQIVLNLKVGPIPVSFQIQEDHEVLWMCQNPPVFQRQFLPQELALILNLDEEEIDANFPIQEVSTGVPFIIVPLKGLQAVRKCRIDRDRYFNLIATTDAKAVLVFAPETYSPENQLNVRMFADYLGVPEDPATGSANGCLAGYLAHYHYFGQSSLNIRVEQGYEMNRPSLLLLKAEKQLDRITVEVGGSVTMVARGEFL